MLPKRTNTRSQWLSYDEDKLSMAVLWTTQFPTDLNDEADIKLHRDRIAQGGTGLALGGGTVLRYVEFAPGYEVRLQSSHRCEAWKP